MAFDTGILELICVTFVLTLKDKREFYVSDNGEPTTYFRI